MSNAKPIKTVIAVAGHRSDPPLHMNMLDDRFIYVNNRELEFPDTPEGRLLTRRLDLFDECAVLYHLVHNVEADVVGLCHYRRFFAFSEDEFGAPTYTPSDSLLRDLFSGGKAVAHFAIGQGSRTSSGIGRRMVPYLKKALKFPEVSSDNKISWLIRQYIVRAPHSNRLYDRNMFVMAWPLAKAYCDWYYSICVKLADMEEDVDSIPPRTFGYLAEYLFSIWLEARIGKSDIISVPFTTFKDEPR